MLAHSHFSGIKRVSDPKDIIILFLVFVSFFDYTAVYVNTVYRSCSPQVKARNRILMKNAPAHCSLH